MAGSAVSGMTGLSASHWGVNQFWDLEKATTHGCSCSFQFVTKEEKNFRYYEYHFQNKI